MRRVSVGPLLSLFLVGILGSTSLGCNKQSVAVAPVEVSDAPATPISDEEFSPVLHQLLLSQDRSLTTKLKLAGVVQYQLRRAQELFDRGFPSEAEDTVTGALLLLRHDDEVLSATRGQAAALVQAGHASARLGEAGRAAALYNLSLPVASDAHLRAELSDHLSAIDSFNQSVVGRTALEIMGEKTRATLARSVVDPSAASYLEAKAAIVGWIRAALA